MQYFTQEDLNPSKKTLQKIRQIAYAYQALRQSKNKTAYCLN